VFGAGPVWRCPHSGPVQRRASLDDQRSSRGSRRRLSRCRPPPCGEGVAFSPTQTTVVPSLQGFRRSTRSCLAPKECRKASRDAAVRRAYRRCVRNVSACSTNRQHDNADLQALHASPLTDSNRRPPPYHGGSHASRASFLMCPFCVRGPLSDQTTSLEGERAYGHRVRWFALARLPHR
jgi:hypothetical protein